MSRVPLHELDSVPVGQILEGLDDLGVLVLVLTQEARLDELRVEVLVHVTHSEKKKGSRVKLHPQ